MGLMICKQLINFNGGVLQVKSPGENKGSIFTFTMKMQIPDKSRIIEHDLVKYSSCVEEVQEED